MAAVYVIKDIILAQWLVVLPLLLLLLLTSPWLWYRKKNREMMKVAARLPSPIPMKIVLGHWYKPDVQFPIPTLTVEEFTRYTMRSMKIAACKPYSQYCLWVSQKPYIFVQKPQDVKILLTSSKAIEKGPDTTLLCFALGDGLLTAKGAKWKISRRYMNPVFHHQNIYSLTDVLNLNSRQLVNDLAQFVGGEEFDVFNIVFKTTVTSVSGIVFGIENQSKMKNEDFELGASVSNSIAYCSGERIFTPWLWSELVFKFLFRKELKDIDETWTRLKHQAMKNTDSEEFYSVIKAYDNIMQEHDIFSKANLDDEMKTILFTGSDSTANGLSACLMLLGKHPDIQEKLYDEIMSLMGSEDQDVTIQDINTLPYLDQVIKESLRIATIVILFQRTLTEEIKLSEGTLPKGGNVHISVIGLHFDPEVYPDPHVFNPEHFTPENVAKRHPYSYLAFSGGPRNCIGKQYALASMKIMLAYILRAYKISASKNFQDLEYTYTVSLKPIDGYKIRLERRSIDK